MKEFNIILSLHGYGQRLSMCEIEVKYYIKLSIQLQANSYSLNSQLYTMSLQSFFSIIHLKSSPKLVQLSVVSNSDPSELVQALEISFRCLFFKESPELAFEILSVFIFGLYTMVRTYQNRMKFRTILYTQIPNRSLIYEKFIKRECLSTK